MLVGPAYDIVDYADNIKYWEPPFASEALDENEKNRILQNVKFVLEKVDTRWIYRNQFVVTGPGIAQVATRVICSRVTRSACTRFQFTLSPSKSSPQTLWLIVSCPL